MWIAISLGLLFVSIVLFKFSTILACLAFAGCCGATAMITREEEGMAMGLAIIVVVGMVLIVAGKEISRLF